MTTSAKAPAPTTPVEPRQTRKFTVDEYYRMAEAGILHHTERVELIEGEIVIMAPIGSRHGSGVARATRLFVSQAAGSVEVWPQNSVQLGEYLELQPDVAILNPRDDSYADSNPGPDDILLVIEVSDTTLAYDRGTKADIYARFNVPEIWVMNLPEDCIEGFSDPGPEGYTRQTTYRRGDKISPAALPDLEFAVDDLLPPLPAAAQQTAESAT